MHQDIHHHFDIGQLARKYFDGTANEEEIAALHRWYQEADETDAAIVEATPETFDAFGDAILHDLKARLEAGKPAASVKKGAFRWIYMAAAIILLLCGWGVYHLVTNSGEQSKIAQTEDSQPDLPPGEDGAILTLSNNRQFNLDELKDGVVMKEKGIEIVKQGNEVSYVITKEASSAVGFNTISTARGQKFKITLPDGTIASLDAASSLQFPASFEGAERKVFVSGQVYFDVAQNARKPFVVSGDGFQVNVLGTRFNVNAYQDDTYKYVTLLQGSVQMTDNKNGVVKTLQPGNQAKLSPAGKLTILPQADIEMVMAWQEGAFQFRDTEIKQVLKQLSRWYQVDIETTLTEERFFTGRINRNISLNAVLEILRLSEIHFRLEGNKLLVLP